MTPSRKYDTVIFGAGPAGMAAAIELCKAKEEFVIVEKSKNVGGLSKTHIIHEDDLEFRTDIGPHRFYAEKSHLHEFVENLLNERWIEVKRQTRQYINGKFFDYPINASQAFRNLGPVNY